MKNKLWKKTLAFLLAALCVMSAASVPAFAAGGWTISSGTRIFWAQTNSSTLTTAGLRQQVQLFDSQLAELLGRSVLSIVYGQQSKAGASDIVFLLDSSYSIPAQGYQLVLSGSQLQVKASDSDGLFYGCTEVIRQLKLSGSVAAGSASPDVAERAVMLDIGRKYYSPTWIKKLIREMAWNKMNTLVLHFSEEMGLGLESVQYPWLNGRDNTLCVNDLGSAETDNSQITQDELRSIAAYAAKYHVELVPSFDSPGHMNYIVKKFNEKAAAGSFTFTSGGVTYTVPKNTDIGNYYHYNGQTAIVQGSRKTAYSRGIDISNEIAVAFTRSLVTEYANLFREFGCTKFDIGGDELLGSGTSLSTTVPKWKQLDHWKTYAQNRSGNSSMVAYDGFMYYINDMYELVSSLGYTSVRMWNDDAFRSSDTGWTTDSSNHVQLNTDIENLYWTPSANSSQNNVWTYQDAGHKVYNYLNYYNYYVLGSPNHYAGASMESIYKNWCPFRFDHVNADLGTGNNSGIGDQNVLGSAFCVWGNKPLETQNEVWTNILPMIQAHAAKAWMYDTNKSESYSLFSSNANKLGNAATEAVTAPEVYELPDMTALETAVNAFGGYDSSLYDSETFAAYQAAVTAGSAVLNKAKPTQTETNNALASINNALAALVLLDKTALTEAVADYDDEDADAWTAESFAAYTAAVTAGRNVLQQTSLTQAQINDAAAAIVSAKAALIPAEPEVDTSELETAIAEFDTFVETDYTVESFAVYASEVAAAREFLEGDEYTQAEVNTVLAAVREARDLLVRAGESWISDIPCINDVTLPSASVKWGKYLTISVNFMTDAHVAEWVILDENNTRRIPIKESTAIRNKKTPQYSGYTAYVQVTKEDRGNWTFTTYAIYEDGTRSADTETFEFTVQ